VIPVTEPIAVRFAEIRALLMRRGELISNFDMLIAATALHYNLTVLTFNLRHFSRIPDLNLYQPD
jgi:tRNA(fMet)-specific endonuclease VapC